MLLADQLRAQPHPRQAGCQSEAPTQGISLGEELWKGQGKAAEYVMLPRKRVEHDGLKLSTKLT